MTIRHPRGLSIAIGLLSFWVAVGVSSTDAASPATGLPPVGEMVGDFTLSDLDGQPHSLEDRRQAGPAVLVFFRGAW